MRVDHFLTSPEILRQNHPLDREAQASVAKMQAQLQAILTGKDPKRILIVGPCSIHHYDGAIRYAKALAHLQKQVASYAVVLMRAHIEKPRTKNSWRGFFYDPDLDGRYDTAKGITLSRQLLIELLHTGVNLSLEMLDPILIPYFEDCYNFALIGARTISSPIHRLAASGLTVPVGYKNRIDGDILSAVEAFGVASQPQTILSNTAQGRIAIRRTLGNPLGCLVLRGGPEKSNYSEADLFMGAELLQSHHLPQSILVDCAHGNSTGHGQSYTFEKMLPILKDPSSAVKGLLLESYLRNGHHTDNNRTSFPSDISITDSCVSIEETTRLFDLFLQAMH